jgi:hypothetical protein
MFDPVWLGNYIVPRWEAFAIVGGFTVVATAVAFSVVIGCCWLSVHLGKRLSKTW